MKLYYYQGLVSNFGDDLNDWLWPKLIPEVLNGDAKDGVFVGIGTLINTKIPPADRVIIFSSGCGYGDLPPEIPASWIFYGVRGPISARILGLDADKVLGDGAILTRTLDLPPPSKTYPVSFMPHWESAVFGAWEKVCAEAGIHFIDPRGTVDDVLDAIRGTQKMLTASMHGAILADAFRVPWVAVRAFGKGHIVKWSDWANTLDMEVKFASLPASSLDEQVHDYWPRLRNLLRRLTFKPLADGEKSVRLSRVLKGDDTGRIRRGARALAEIAKATPQLSTDAATDRVTQRLVERVAQFRRDYANGFAGVPAR